MREAGLPVGGDLAGLLRDGVDVVGQGEGDDVSFQPVDHRPCLLARAAVRLPYGHGLARLGLPVPGEFRVEILVKLAGGIVGHVEQGGLRMGGAGDAGGEGKGKGKGEQAAAKGAERHGCSPCR